MEVLSDGLNIKLERIKAGIKAYDLAHQLKWHPSKLSLVENNRIKLKLDQVAKIMQAIAKLNLNN
jgi:hypothetical protein